jgi:alkylation response protein AidB-like acyl-CoA dehydrogenase
MCCMLHPSDTIAPTINGKFSLRASVTGQIVMEDVRVPAGNKLNVKGMKVGFVSSSTSVSLLLILLF